MPGEVKLKPCPFCGGEAERYETDSGCVKVNCRKCHIETPWGKHRFERDDIDKWNRRAPEPGASVIRWTRYDGRQETLPDDDWCLVQTHDKRGFIPRKALFNSEGYRKGEPNIWNMTDYAQQIQIGDIWAYLPDPPEGME